MKTFAMALVALCAAGAWASEKADETTVEVVEALGVKEGEKVPERRRRSDTHKTVRVADYPVKAGLDGIQVYYTDESGVCWVVGIEYVFSASDDDLGIRHKKAADGIAERVEAKLGKSATKRENFHKGTSYRSAKEYWLESLKRGTAGYSFVWKGKDAKPFYEVEVRVNSVGIVWVRFDFMNTLLCSLEQDDDF